MNPVDNDNAAAWQCSIVIWTANGLFELSLTSFTILIKPRNMYSDRRADRRVVLVLFGFWDWFWYWDRFNFQDFRRFCLRFRPIFLKWNIAASIVPILLYRQWNDRLVSKRCWPRQSTSCIHCTSHPSHVPVFACCSICFYSWSMGIMIHTCERECQRCRAAGASLMQ